MKIIRWNAKQSQHDYYWKEPLEKDCSHSTNQQRTESTKPQKNMWNVHHHRLDHHLVGLLVEHHRQRQNGAPFLESRGKWLPAAVELAGLQANGRRRVVAGVTETLSNGRDVADVGTDVLQSKSLDTALHSRLYTV